MDIAIDVIFNIACNAQPVISVLNVMLVTFSLVGNVLLVIIHVLLAHMLHIV